MNRKSIYTTLFLTLLLGIGGQTATTPREGIFNLQGQRLRSLQQGINIVNGKKVLKR